jgi:hypothetical protein
MDIISLVSIVIIIFIVFLVFLSKPSKVEKFNSSNLNLVFNENDFIDFTKFNNREIRYANYGSQDVTEIIKKAYETWKSQRFLVSNNNMGSDPNYGDVKKLKIWYNDNNNNNNIDLAFSEYDFVDFQRFIKEPKYAKYGSESKTVDVTTIIKEAYKIWKLQRFNVKNIRVNTNLDDEQKLTITFY